MFNQLKYIIDKAEKGTTSISDVRNIRAIIGNKMAYVEKCPAIVEVAENAISAISAYADARRYDGKNCMRPREAALEREAAMAALVALETAWLDVKPSDMAKALMIDP